MAISPFVYGNNYANDSSKLDESGKNKNDNQKGDEEPPKIGNFALPNSQQPGPLVSFGENIVDKGQVLLFLFADDFQGKEKCTIDIIPSLLYGITNDFSIFLNAPFTPLMRDGHHHSNGLEDFFTQLEYAFYNKKTHSYFDQATIVGNVTFPTGSIDKDPPTGFGSPSFFIGGTFNHMTVDWFVFTSHGGVFTTSNRGSKLGNQLLYQFGFGGNITYSKEWLYAWMVEIDGQYSWKNKIHGIVDPNSGGNVIFITPSLWISSKHLILQFGAGAPLV